jgi:Mrp family chromosome partitioning ATPase
MARIREALRGNTVIRETAAPIATRETPASPKPSPVEEIPFIEVGGRQTPIEASPSVLAASPRTSAIPREIQKPEAPGPQILADPPHAIPAPNALSFKPFPELQPGLAPPEDRFAKDLVTFHQPDHPAAAQYRELATALENQLGTGKPQVLLFVPGNSSVDGTTVLLNLAIARVRQRTAQAVLVDASIRRPALAGRLGLPGAPGLREVLAGQLSLRRALVETGEANLLALVAGAGSENDSSILARPAMRSVLNHLRGRFDWTLVAAPVWSGRPEQAALAAGCDAVYLVLASAGVDDSQRDELMHVMVEQGAPVRGSIFAG